MRAAPQFAIQSVFAALHSTVILGGSMATAAMMKWRGYPDPTQFWHPIALFVREWGFLLIALPGLWVGWTIWMERGLESRFSKRWSLLSGAGLLGVLCLFFLGSILLGSGAGRTITTMKRSH